MAFSRGLDLGFRCDSFLNKRFEVLSQRRRLRRELLPYNVERKILASWRVSQQLRAIQAATSGGMSRGRVSRDDSDPDTIALSLSTPAQTV